MANCLTYKDQQFHVGDLIKVAYKLKEGNKERLQNFEGYLINIRGNRPENKAITVRKISKSGIGVEKILPIASPFVVDIKPIKSSQYKKATAYFIRHLSGKELKRKLFKTKKK
jgi:large subunit ribosomal protein L19